jgi:hypothetical protein
MSPSFCRSFERWRLTPASIPVTIWGAPDNLDRVKCYCDQGISRVVVSLPSAPSVEILPTLDRWAEIIRKSADWRIIPLRRSLPVEAWNAL